MGFEKAKAAFDTTLLLVGANELLIRKLSCLQDVGCDDERGPTPFFLGNALLIEGKRELALPALPRHSLLRRASFALIVVVSQIARANLEPGRQVFEALCYRRLGISLASKALREASATTVFPSAAAPAPPGAACSHGRAVRWPDWSRSPIALFPVAT